METPPSPDRAESLLTEEGYRIPASDAEILDLLPAAEDRPPVVAVRHENSVYGLSATSGRELWSCEEGRYRIGHGWMIPKVTLLTGGNRRELPRVVAEFPNEVTVCRQAILTDANPPDALARTAPRIADSGEDPRLVRPLPWAGAMSGKSWIDEVVLIVYGMLLATAVIALPGGIAWRMVRRRRWSLRTMLLLPVVVAIVVTVLAADLPFASPYVHLVTVGAKPGLAVTSLPGVVFAGLVIHCAWTRRWRRLIRWLTTSVVVSLLMAGVGVIVDSLGRPAGLGERYTATSSRPTVSLVRTVR